jgi:hypothetical protein
VRSFGCWLLGPLWLAGCAYLPGSLATRPGIREARVGCLEIGIRSAHDPVIGFTVGNTCRYPVGVEFRNVVVRAWDELGIEYRPRPADPRHELFTAAIDGNAEISLALDYPMAVATPRFCVDVGRLNVDEPAAAPVDLCFREDAVGRIVSDFHPELFVPLGREAP